MCFYSSLFALRSTDRERASEGKLIISKNMTSSVFCMAVVAFMAFVARAEEELAYRVPDQIMGMEENSQAYQIGVWSFIMLIFIGYYAFYATGGMDYSNETLLTVEVEKDQHQD